LPRPGKPTSVRKCSRRAFDPISEKLYEPLFQRWAQRFARLRVLQQGKIHVYLVYVVLMVALALTWFSVRRWWGT